eukprot:13698606-Alexandrium_andersonii.AAC.1
MSASLVGSEMCIRDRPARSSGGRSATSWRSASNTRPRRASPSSGRTRTVSYTHLTLPTICSV